MAFRLNKRGAASASRLRTITLDGPGITFRQRRVTTALNEAASAAAARRVAEVAKAVAEAREAGVAPDGSVLDVTDRDNATGLFTQFHIEELMKRLVVSWEGVVDEAGEPVPPSPDAFAILAEERSVGAPWFNQTLLPLREEAEEKNASSPSAGGSTAPAPGTATDASPTMPESPPEDASPSAPMPDAVPAAPGS